VIRTAIIALTILTTGLLTMEAYASPADCEYIKDADQKHYCRALSKPDKSQCEYIKNRDLKMQCRALAEKKP